MTLGPLSFRIVLLLCMLLAMMRPASASAPASAEAEQAARALLRRVAGATSDRIILRVLPSETDFFDISSRADSVMISGNSAVSLAAGFNWYVKYYLGQHLSWSNMTVSLPEQLPLPDTSERHDASVGLRYYLNYCTFSYSMPFWDWERWQKEIDWMALHGVNMPLALVGTDAAWRQVMLRLGYKPDEANAFVAGPAYQAWWLMNNLEGAGGPNSDAWYARSERLQRNILARMRELGMKPVLPGYAGMLPHDAQQRMGVDVADPGRWLSYQRPAFLQPTDSNFDRVADIYYGVLDSLYGSAPYYAMDPFHEGGNTRNVNLDATGRALLGAMKRHAPNAAWVVQCWGANPRPDMIRNLPKGDVLVLDLFSESNPQWGDPQWPRTRKDGFLGHDWAFCMLLNFGGNVGLHGKMQHVADAFSRARTDSAFSSTLRGVGMTMEGIDNNPVMYELLSELPWRDGSVDITAWLPAYTKARYGATYPQADEAWRLLAQSVYNCPPESQQQGTTESIFCARPAADAREASSWNYMTDYYDGRDVVRAADLLDSLAPMLDANPNFRYDRIDVRRQANAELARRIHARMARAIADSNASAFDTAAAEFENLMLRQDSLLSSHPTFRLDTYLAQADAASSSPEERTRLRGSLITQITTWGNRAASESGLHDYSHREWAGLLRNYYLPRWRVWIARTSRRLHGKETPGDAEPIDWFAIESALAASLAKTIV